MSVKIGKSLDSVKGKRKNYFKLKDGDNVYMILPALGDLAESGQWNAYHATVYGYKNSQGKLRSFASNKVVNRKTKMVEVPCLATDRAEQLQAQYAEALKNRNVEEAKRLKSLKERYNVDKKYYVNAMTLDGTLGILKVPYKAMEALRQEIKRQESAGVDVRDVENGRFMLFRRSGTGLDTIHQVATYREKIQVQGLGEVEKEKVATLSNDILARLKDEVSLNLKNIVRVLSVDEVTRLVKADMAGDMATVDSILDKNSREDDSDDSGDESDTTEVQTQTTLSKAVETGAKATSGATTTSTTTALAASTVSVPKDVNAMSEADFLDLIGKQ